MPKLEGHHPYCHSCGGDNETPRYKWCPDCREAERRKKRCQRNSDGVQKQKTNACGLHYIQIVDAAAPTDALPGGLRVRPGHAPGWLEVI
jgi:hypothetical protein